VTGKPNHSHTPLVI